jgi:hypothetical protein
MYLAGGLLYHCQYHVSGHPPALEPHTGISANYLCCISGIYEIMNTRSLLTILLLILALTATAQKRKKAPVLTPEEQEHLEKMERMRASTEKVMFIDSLVVDKSQFLQYYNLNPECGSLKTYKEVYNSDKQPRGFVHITDMEKMRLFSKENNEGIINLYYQERIANKWQRESRISGVNDGKRFTRVNFPFMMGDGQTLYFAADGKEGIGGYDIYVTRYNKETGRYLKAESIGMPFNSEANDYMYAIDEYDSLGWFATDRNQPEGKVCIYTFIPSPIRQTYDTEVYSPEEIKQFADISDISKTWTDSLALVAARSRLRMSALRKKQQTTGREFTFVINDNLVYTRLADFKAPENSRRYFQLMELSERHQKINKALRAARDSYHTAEQDEKEELREVILTAERRCQELRADMKKLEKTIRNLEILCLTNKK